MKWTTIASLAMLALVANVAIGANLITESFEADPGATYTLTTEFDDGGFDFWGRYAVPDNSNAARDDFQNGWDGSFGIIGQDHDAEGGPATTLIDINGIDISGAPQVLVTIALGALNSEPMFANYEAADGDQLEIFGQIDGGGYVLLGGFYPPLEGQGDNQGGPQPNAGDLYRDTDSDGIGDGKGLTVDLTDFRFVVPGTGSTFDLQIASTSTDSFEPIAVDNVRIDSVPEPTSVAMLMAGAAMLVGLRKRS